MPGIRPREVLFTKTCTECRQPFHRRDNESATNYRRRKTCSNECRRAREKRTKGQAHVLGPRACTQCGASMPKAKWESASQYNARKYCSRECMAAGQRGNKRASDAADRRGRAERKKAERVRRKKLAPDGYVFDGRFPTPAAARPRWQTVTGPDATPANAPVVPHKALKRPASLTEAVRVHPELAAALHDVLTGNWHPTR